MLAAWFRIFAMQAMNIYVVFQYKEDTSQCDNLNYVFDILFCLGRWC